MSKPNDNGHRIRISDRIGFRLRDNWFIIAPILVIIWALVLDHFTIIAHAGEIKDLKEIVREQAREQSRNQREINNKLTTQATTNGRIEATQKAIQSQLQQLIKITLANGR
jgi:TRAP-type uncharacterized transport system fused permease subunit